MLPLPKCPVNSYLSLSDKRKVTYTGDDNLSFSSPSTFSYYPAFGWYVERMGSHGPWTKGVGFVTPTRYSYRGWLDLPQADGEYIVRNPCVSNGINRTYWKTTWGANTWGFTTVSGYASTPPNWLTKYVSSWRGFDIDLVHRSQAQAFAKAQQGDFNLSTFLAEAPESIKMAANIIGGAALILRGIKRGRLRDIRRGVDLVLGSGAASHATRKSVTERRSSSAWLQWQYGIAPLLSDISAIQKTVSNGLDQPNKFISTSSTVKSPYTGEDLSSRPKSNSWSKCCPKFELKTNISVRTKVRYRISSPWLKALSDLGLTNPLLTGWEMIPFSFVLDWFIPVGTWLSALNTNLGLEYVSGFTTIQGYSSVSATFMDTWCRNTELVSGSLPEIESRFMSMERRVLDSTPFPTLYTKNPFSSTHVTSALALVSQLRR